MLSIQLISFLGATGITLLLLQQGSYKVHRLGVRFISLTRPLCTTGPQCDHSWWGLFRILVQVSQQLFVVRKTIRHTLPIATSHSKWHGGIKHTLGSQLLKQLAMSQSNQIIGGPLGVVGFFGIVGAAAVGVVAVISVNDILSSIHSVVYPRKKSRKSTTIPFTPNNVN